LTLPNDDDESVKYD